MSFLSLLTLLVSLATAPSVATATHYVPRIEPFGDSLVVGANATVCGWREGVYGAAQTAGTPIFFIGSQDFSGTNSTFTIDPHSEGYGGITAAGINTHLSVIPTDQPDIIIYAAGTNELNDVNTCVADISAGLDTAWNNRFWPWTRIVLVNILNRLDANGPNALAVDALLPAMVAGKSYAARVSIADVSTCIPNQQVGVNMFDQIHPNGVGYPFMAAVIWPVIKAAMAQAHP